MRLIDADALLEMVDKERQYLIARGQKGAEHILVHNFRDLIDNAPTVCNDNYAMGYQDGVRKVLSERPQGEWIILDGGDRACPFCNMGTSRESNTSIVFFHYCPYCGAELRVKDELEGAENDTV